MMSPVDTALAHVRGLTPTSAGLANGPVTVNFHPDTRMNGTLVVDHLARDGVYRSQFETGTSNGGVSAFRGGERWIWESRIFGRAYDEAPSALRPKYGALNVRQDPVGGSPRFGSCHLRLHRRLMSRTTFCYPDSHLQPQDFGLEAASVLVALAEENRLNLDAWLDNYVEAHVHGVLRVSDDVEAVVLDPSYRGTAVEEAARGCGCPIEWHDGFRLGVDRHADCLGYRGPVAAEALIRIAIDGVVTPAILGKARDRLLDAKTAKWLWHCLVRFGRQGQHLPHATASR